MMGGFHGVAISVCIITATILSVLLSPIIITPANAVHIAVDDIQDSLFVSSPGVADLGNSSVLTRYPSTGPAGCIWIVLYYVSSCGHCRNFAPKFSQLSAWIDAKKKVVAAAAGAAAVDGGEDDAAAVTSSSSLAALPSVVVSAINCGQFSTDCRLNKIADVPTIRLHYADQDAPNGVRVVDVSTHGANASVDESCWGVQAGFPSCGWVSPLEMAVQNVYQRMLARPERSEQVCTAVGAFLCSSKHVLLQKQAADARRSPMTPSEMSVLRKDVSHAHRQDVAGALMYSLWHEVPMAPQTPMQAQALAHFLSSVCTTFPWLNCKPLIAHTRVTSTTKWRQAVLACAIPFKLSGPASDDGEGSPHSQELTVHSPLTSLDIEWRGCRGSAPEFRGFTCGLWMLYHGLTVHSTEPLQALSAIQSYVRNFFLCQECRVHFESIRFTATEPAAFQLWRAHNDVNMRLKNEPSDDPLVPKSHFPSSALCPSCVTNTPNVIMPFLLRYFSALGDGTKIEGKHNIVKAGRSALHNDDNEDEEAIRRVLNHRAHQDSNVIGGGEIPIGLRQSTILISGVAVGILLAAGFIIGTRAESLSGARHGVVGGRPLSSSRSTTGGAPPLRSLV